jgi:hypothetical protein
MPAYARPVVAALVASGVSLVLSATTLAATNPMTITGQAPADGLSAPASNYPVATDAEMLTFAVDLAAPLDSGVNVSVEIASSPTLGQDGTLSDDDNVATLLMAAGDTDPRHVAVRTEPFNAWLGKPGTYYWMVHYWTLDLEACVAGCTWVSPVRSFRLTAPKIVLGVAEAKEQASNALAQRYGKTYTTRAINVRISCARKLSATVRRCSASWQRKGISYRARLDVVEKPGGNYAYRNAKLTQRR